MPTSRRRFLHLFGGIAATWPGLGLGAAPALRIGLTPAILRDRYSLTEELQAYLAERLGQAVRMVQVEGYGAAKEFLKAGKLEAAWLCDCPYAAFNPALRLLATPLFQGRPYYRAYLIVSQRDTQTRGYADLRGKVFAYTDPHSNVGYLTPRAAVRRLGADPDHFFGRTFLVQDSRKAIEAVAVGLADAASVNGYIWETLDSQAPVLTSRSRLVERSREYGFPPLVTPRTLPTPLFDGLQAALLGMAGNPRGRELLAQLNLDGFISPRTSFYQSTRELVEAAGEGGGHVGL